MLQIEIRQRKDNPTLANASGVTMSVSDLPQHKLAKDTDQSKHSYALVLSVHFISNTHIYNYINKLSKQFVVETYDVVFHFCLLIDIVWYYLVQVLPFGRKILLNWNTSRLRLIRLSNLTYQSKNPSLRDSGISVSNTYYHPETCYFLISEFTDIFFLCSHRIVKNRADEISNASCSITWWVYIPRSLWTCLRSLFEVSSITLDPVSSTNQRGVPVCVGNPTQQHEIQSMTMAII